MFQSINKLESKLNQISRIKRQVVNIGQGDFSGSIFNGKRSLIQSKNKKSLFLL